MYLRMHVHAHICVSIYVNIFVCTYVRLYADVHVSAQVRKLTLIFKFTSIHQNKKIKKIRSNSTTFGQKNITVYAEDMT